MSPAAEHVYLSALALSPAEQVAVAEALLAGPDHPPAPDPTGDDYRAEIRRRSAETGDGVWSTWDDARRRVHARLGFREPADD